MRIQGFPWTSPSSTGIALKVAFESNNYLREILRNGTQLDEGDADPNEPVVHPVNEDDNDSVNDFGDNDYVSWERTVDVAGGSCTNCSQAMVRHDVYRSGEYSGDVDGIATMLGNAQENNFQVSMMFRVSYISIIPPAGCQPSDILWDPDYSNSDANAAWGVMPSLALLAALFCCLY